MKKKNTTTPKLVIPKDDSQSHEVFFIEQAEMGWEAAQLKEQEDFLSEVKHLTKSELVQLVQKARNEAEQFSGWLILNEWSNSEINEKFNKVRQKENDRIKKLILGRQDQAIKKVARSAKAEALGVTDFYELIRDALKIYDSWDDATKDQYSTETSGIQKIVIDLLSQPNRSIHTYNKDEWAKIVSKQIKSMQVGIAKTQLKRALKEAT
jgi:hypothetical protein